MREQGGIDEMKARVRAMFEAGVAAADPARAVSEAMDWARADPPRPGGHRQVVALGKAGLAMATAALAALPSDTAALIVTNPENAQGAQSPAGARLIAGDHPVPGPGSQAAGRAILETLARLGPQDRVLALISGGGSALAVAPSDGLSLSDKAEVSRLLLGCGADIVQMNLIRQQLSRLKGGGWLAASAAPVTGLILSDVPGDDLAVIASGPTVAPIGTRAQAADLCRDLGIWDQLPASVRTHLGQPEPTRDRPQARNRLIGANGISVAAMLAAGAQAAPFALSGDVGDLAPRIVALLADLAPGTALAFGGESTVTLRGDGLGGRNQELALRVALLAEQAGVSGPWCFLSGGTDGRDGPTDAAGGLVDPQTCESIRAGGEDPQSLLNNNDSYRALRAGGALLMTGATGTNVADLAILARG
jgi:hydroxypyruvate reductase